MRIILAFLCLWSLNAIGVTTLYVSNPPQVTNYFLYVGQSNAEGTTPSVSLYPQYPDRDLMWSAGMHLTNGPFTYIIPACEFTTGNANGESPCSGLINQLTAWNGGGHMAANFAQGGQNYFAIKKGGSNTCYAGSMDSVTNLHLKFPSARVGAVYVDLGETPPGAGDSRFGGYMAELQSDYETDIKAVTGQTGTIPLFITQLELRDVAGSVLNLVETNSKCFITHPRYTEVYLGDHLHMYASNYVTIGEYGAMAFTNWQSRGAAYTPLRPIWSHITNTTQIDICYTGMVGNITFDTTLVWNNPNKGYYLGTSDGANLSGAANLITNVAIQSAASGIVRLSCSNAPNAGHYVRVGLFDGTGDGPLSTGCNSNLRDSNTTVGRSGLTLYNWAVLSFKPIAWTAP